MNSRRSSDTESQAGDATLDKRRSKPIFKRLTSTESTVSSIRLSVFDLSTQPQRQQKYSLCSVEFLIKLVQLLITIACIGLYSNGIHFMKNSEPSMIFPNIVYGAFIIITTVTVLSYILGHLMPPIIVRIFLLIGVVLYFIAGCVTLYGWYRFAKDKEEASEVLSARMLFADSFLNLLNCILYGCDLYLSIKRSVTV